MNGEMLNFASIDSPLQLFQPTRTSVTCVFGSRTGKWRSFPILCIIQVVVELPNGSNFFHGLFFQLFRATLGVIIFRARFYLMISCVYLLEAKQKSLLRFNLGEFFPMGCDKSSNLTNFSKVWVQIYPCQRILKIYAV